MKRTEDAAEICKPPPKRVNGMTLRKLLFSDDEDADVDDNFTGESSSNEQAAPDDHLEQWKSMQPIGLSRYDISDLGKIMSRKDDRILRPFMSKTGNLYIALTNDEGRRISRFLHALVAQMFLEPDPSRKFVLHKNGDPYDNSAANLKWANTTETNQTRAPQINDPTKRRTVEQIKDGVVIRTFMGAKQAAVELGVSRDHILCACKDATRTVRGCTWRYKTEPDLEGEEWRYVEKYNMTVSNCGRFKNSKGVIVYGSVTHLGYQTISRPMKMRPDLRAHNLVALAFIGECPPGMTVDHIDQNKLNNHVRNLRYVTPSEQARNRPSNRVVYQYTTDGTFVRSFKGLQYAAEHVGTASSGAIGNACRLRINKQLGTIRTSGGYIWKYEDDVPVAERHPQN